MQKLELAGFCFLAVVCLSHVAQAFPESRYRTWYECYCPQNPKCGRFTCRNYEYTCNCRGCSCFAPTENNGKANGKPSENEFLDLLLRTGLASGVHKRSIDDEKVLPAAADPHAQ